MSFLPLKRLFELAFGGSARAARGTRPAARNTHLTLEQLEDRRVLSANVTSSFIAEAYHALLNRPADPAGLAYWSDQAAGIGFDGVAQGIESSAEHLQVDVQNLYDTILGHSADPGALAYWVGQLEAGVSAQQAKASILGSDEFFQHAKASVPSYLTDLYQNDLGRAPGASDLGYWQGMLSAGTARSDVALQIINSPEALARDVQGAYPLFLGRGADPGGVSYWSSLIASNPSQSPADVLAAGLMGSGEDVARLSDFDTANPAVAKTTDPNLVASTYLNSQFDSAWQLPNTSSAAANWSSSGYDPWLPVNYAQTPTGMSNWSSYVGINPIDDAAFWASIGGSPSSSGSDRPVRIYNDGVGYQTTPQTASSISSYPNGNNIRIFPGQYLDANDGSSWGLDSTGSGSGGGNTQGITYDDSVPRGGLPSSGWTSDTSNSNGSSIDPLGNGTDVLGGWEVPATSFDPFAGTSDASFTDTSSSDWSY